MANYAPYLSIRRSKKVPGGWYWCVVGVNGNEMATSKVYEGRNSKSNAKRACRSAMRARTMRVEL